MVEALPVQEAKNVPCSKNRGYIIAGINLVKIWKRRTGDACFTINPLGYVTCLRAVGAKGTTEVVREILLERGCKLPKQKEENDG